MKIFLNEDNQIHNFISSSGSGTVISYGSGSNFLTSYVPVPVPLVKKLRFLRFRFRFRFHNTAYITPHTTLGIMSNAWNSCLEFATQKRGAISLYLCFSLRYAQDAETYDIVQSSRIEFCRRPRSFNFCFIWTLSCFWWVNFVV